MSSVAIFSVGRFVTASITLAGLVIGVVGSLFFTYDLLGRPGGPLRVFLRILIPAGLGAVLLGVPAFLYGGVSIGRGDPGTVGILGGTLLIGVTLGTFNGLFVSDPTQQEIQPRVLSGRDGLLGALFVLLYTAPLMAILSHLQEK